MSEGKIGTNIKKKENSSKAFALKMMPCWLACGHEARRVKAQPQGERFKFSLNKRATHTIMPASDLIW